MSTPADRQREYRRRQRRGEAILAVKIDENAVAGAMLAAGLLTAEAALDRHELERAISGMVNAWARDWRSK